MDEALIQKIVAEVVRRLKAMEKKETQAPEPPVMLVTEALVLETLRRGSDAVHIAPNAIVTPLARDVLRREKVRLIAVAGAGEAPAQRSMAIAIGADHRGFALKAQLKAWLKEIGREVIDVGVHTAQEISYVKVAKTVARKVVEGGAVAGIVIDGGGIPSSMAANRVKGVRAAACQEVTSAKFARAHTDANVLCLGAGVVGDALAREIVEMWLHTPFEGGRYAAQVQEMDGSGVGE